MHAFVGGTVEELAFFSGDVFSDAYLLVVSGVDEVGGFLQALLQGLAILDVAITQVFNITGKLAIVV
ncbi:MAG: hypothetical protein RI559_13835 [Marinospirillum sp.]|nr:hypothetical protein [Marinospirillum sp.]